jgi:DNA-binding PadR family transcriptional regulator
MTELTPTSYLMVALVERSGEATAYDLKRMLELAFRPIWWVPHTQVYRESARLVASGHLREQREDSGRRRRLYTVTASGRQALHEWLKTPTSASTELRDVGLLKILLGADPALLAPEQLAAHRQRLAETEELRANLQSVDAPGLALVLEAGIAHERQWVRFWSQFASHPER